MDIQVLLWFQNLRTPLLNALNYGITLLAEEAVLLVVLSVLYWCVHKKNALFIIFNFLAGMVVNSALKVSFCVQRPWVRDARIVPYEKAFDTATGYSFPSGHVACATSVYGSFALFAWNKRRWVSAAMIAVTLLVAVARMYVGVHTLQDVVVSLVVGAAMILATHVGQRWLEAHPEKDVWLLGGMLALALALVLYTYYKPYPLGTDRTLLTDTHKTAGALAGLAVGWFVERRWINFSVKAPLWFQAVKVAGGIAGILAVRALLKPVCIALAGEEIGSALRYFILLIWAMGLWPLLFKAILRKIDGGKGAKG